MKAKVLYTLGNTIRFQGEDGKDFTGDVSRYGEVEEGQEVEIKESSGKQIPIADLSAQQIQKYNPDLFQEIQDLTESVEDEPDVLRLGRRILERAGYRVLSAESGDRALDLLATAEEMPDLVLTDVAMPGMSGPELVERLRERGIDAPVLLTSGHAETPAASAGTPFLPKPFSRAALLAAVADGIKGGRS